MLTLRWTDHWSESFFAEFRALHVRRWPALRGAEEKLSDLRALWGPQGTLASLREFKAYLLLEGSQVKARALMSVARQNPRFAALGYYERLDADSGVALLRRIEEDFAPVLQRHQGLAIRAPIQGHFFNSYRMKTFGHDKDFYGEPPLTPEYGEDFQSAGYLPFGRWKTVEIRRAQAEGQFERIWRAVEPRWKKSGLRIRQLRPGEWSRELRHLYDLLQESFDQMPNYEPMPWEQFAELFHDMKYVIDPRFVFFAEDDRGIQGFAVTIKDPLSILKTLENRSHAWPALKNLFQAWTLLRLKFHRGRMLVMYIGKRPNSRAPWIGAALGRKIVSEGIRQGYKSALICYLASESPVLANLPAGLREISRYELFQKEWKV